MQTTTRALKLLQEYIDDMGPDDPAYARDLALFNALRDNKPLAEHKDTLYGLAACDWSFDELYFSL